MNALRATGIWYMRLLGMRWRPGEINNAAPGEGRRGDYYMIKAIGPSVSKATNSIHTKPTMTRGSGRADGFLLEEMPETMRHMPVMQSKATAIAQTNGKKRISAPPLF